MLLAGTKSLCHPQALNRCRVQSKQSCATRWFIPMPGSIHEHPSAHKISYQTDHTDLLKLADQFKILSKRK
jgi:hypothetical protein